MRYCVSSPLHSAQSLILNPIAQTKQISYYGSAISSMTQTNTTIFYQKTMALHDEPQVHDIQTQSLFCEEEHFDGENWGSLRKNQPFLPFNSVENDPFCEDKKLQLLISKQDRTHVCNALASSDGYLIQARNEALSWIFDVQHHYGFSVLTSVLAVNYFDRFVSNVRLKREKPWMCQLAAVACLSLAAKVEETHVPLLLDFQVVDSKFLFEAKTIQRMELLVLSSLQWKMHPLTPFSFFHHIVKRLPLKDHVHWELLERFQSHLLSIIADHRYLCYLPSVLATATILHIINEIESYDFLECQNELLSVLKINKNQLNECCKFILDSLGSHGNFQNPSNINNLMCGTVSPRDVMDGYFISDSSNDSWLMVPSISP